MRFPCAVATAPGTDFAKTDPGFLRVNFTKSPQDVEEGLRRISEFLVQYLRHFIFESPQPRE